MVLAASLSNIDFDFIDAVHGEQVLDKVLPPGVGRAIGEPNLGSWRGHLNAIIEVVKRNLTSALILEDDADWDVRIKEQLWDLARSSRALIQPLASDPSKYADATYPIPESSSALPKHDIKFDALPKTVPPKDSVYGDGWDVLWLGHCGMRFPVDGMARAEWIPKGRVIRSQDLSVPEPHNFYSVSSVLDLKDGYGNHTRAVSHAADGICSLGYAVTQAGARRLLHSLGLSPMTGAFDIMLKQFCDGTKGEGPHNCLTVRPGLFQHHLPAGSKAYESDITSHGTDNRDKASSQNLRWSVKLNYKALLAGETDFVDQFPDTAV
ncbi:hypothetical protein BJ875DRAFT_430610 [Amylocarpus encephaloides]|uniref:Glycosyltransferase family 25 protein n=1 Tax=Amylocarpus encephaloides TaxID=45428 RepID=A0A9P7YC73_9HELO|nr:hypothetical protein BJ875DRAFT_430610 [Amylocarpus encephaloides]